MSSNPIRLQYLLRKYLENKLTADEHPEFWNLLSELSENDLVSEELHQLWDRQAIEASIAPEQVQSAYQQLQYKIIQQKLSHYHRFGRFDVLPGSLLLLQPCCFY